MFESIGNRARIKKANAALITGVLSGELKRGHRFGWGVDSSFEVGEIGEDDVEIIRMASGGLTDSDTSQPNMNTGGPVDTKYFEDRSVDTEKPSGGYMPPKKPILGPRFKGGDVKIPANPAGGITEPKDVFGPYPVSERPLYPMRKPLDPYSSSTIKVPNGGNYMTRRPIEELLQGEIFSINSKAQKFVLASIDAIKENGMVIARTLGDVAKELSFPFSDIKGHRVFVWGRQEEKVEKFPEPFDRVACLANVDGKRVDFPGTALMSNTDKKTVRVLWDVPIAGQQVTSEALVDIKLLGVKASGKQLDFSKKVSIIIKEGEELSAIDSGSSDLTIVKKEISEQITKDKQAVEATTQKKTEDIIRLVVDANLKDFKRIEQSGVLMVTAGENNYQIDEIAGLIRGYQDYILNRVTDTIRSLNVRGTLALHIPVTAGIMKMMSDNMLNSYFMTRDGYIREEGNNRWAVYNKSHALLGKFANKRKALAQIRSRDYRIRKGLEE